MGITEKERIVGKMPVAKLCPFCGGDARINDVQVSEDCTETWVQCKGCAAQGPRVEDAYVDAEAAVELWNKAKR